MTYHIIKAFSGHYIAEAGTDGNLHLMHSEPIADKGAAERLRDDLAGGRCPLDLTPSPSGGFDPGEHVARCYGVAARIVPLLPKGKDAWAIALRIADAEPWIGPRAHSDFDSDRIPF